LTAAVVPTTSVTNRRVSASLEVKVAAFVQAVQLLDELLDVEGGGLKPRPARPWEKRW
jgi:hypothetical protein